MIDIQIPGYSRLQLEHLVLDFNGTLAVDGRLLPGVADRLMRLGEVIQVHVITADTFGSVQEALADLPCTLHILSAQDQDKAKQDYVRRLNRRYTVSVGNGRNDCLMLRESVLGIGVILEEGAASDVVMEADIICTDILAALELLLKPLRLTATLRS